ncbi:MAG: hypothetical protein ACE5MM_07235 [Nitrospiraceae bacterium]
MKKTIPILLAAFTLSVLLPVGMTPTGYAAAEGEATTVPEGNPGVSGSHTTYVGPGLRQSSQRIATTSGLVHDLFNALTPGSTRMISDAEVASASILNMANTDVLILTRPCIVVASNPTVCAQTFSGAGVSLSAAGRANVETFLNAGGTVVTEFSSNTLFFQDNSGAGAPLTPLPNLAFPTSVRINGFFLTGFDFPPDVHTVQSPLSPFAAQLAAGLPTTFRDDHQPGGPGAGDLHFNLEGDLAGNGIEVVTVDSDETFGQAPTAIETLAVARSGKGCWVSMNSDWHDTHFIGSSLPNGVDADIIRLWVNAGNFKCVIPVDIDIKPGSDPNSINCESPGGVIAVAILTTDDFDATTVDHTTVEFGPSGAKEIHSNKQGVKRHEADVDGDGDIDLVLHFRFGETGLTCDSTDATLTGSTFGGIPIEGSDSVRMVPPS